MRQEKIWEDGCKTALANAVGATEAAPMGPKDELKLLETRIAELEPTPSPAAEAN